MSGLTINQKKMFAPLGALIKSSFPRFPDKARFPTVDALDKTFYHINEKSRKLKLTCQDQELPHQSLGYEERIFLHGIIATRQQNWHDFFNAQVWQLFPKTKTSLNQIHYQELKCQEHKTRSRRRDLLTLFDENGVFIKAPSSIKELIRNHQWHELFCDNKNSWLDKTIEIVTFGHALYEKYLNPYIGMTAHAVFVDEIEVKTLDALFSKSILEDKALVQKHELSPMPLLGIPGWHNNQDAEFYNNKSYFR